MKTKWFQQDGAPQHTAKAMKQFFWTQFPECLIILYKDIQWSLYSTDLALPDIFLWVYFKDHIYANPMPRKIELKANTKREIQNIPQKPFLNVMNKVAIRMQAIIGRKEGYINHVV